MGTGPLSTLPGEDPQDALPGLAGRRWLVVGIGNDLRGDDAFGPLLARRLLEAGRPAIDAGMAPENVTGPVLRAAPDVLLLADATDLGAAPGTVRILRPGDLLEGGSSTHDPSLTMLLAYLEDRQPGLEVYFVAAQAGTRALGAEPAKATLDAVENVARLLVV